MIKIGYVFYHAQEIELEKNISLHIGYFRKVMDTVIEKKEKLDKEVSDKVSFLSFIIPKFAETYKMNFQEAYFYLKRYGGIDYLSECWWALHTDNDIWAVHDIYNVCHQNGGMK